MTGQKFGDLTAIFQSTPSVWRETALQPSQKITPTISIHSLRVEGDASRESYGAKVLDFNPLPPCGGRRRVLRERIKKRQFQSPPSVWRETRFHYSNKVHFPFQSTPSVWRETPVLGTDRSFLSYFNPLPPCGGRRQCDNIFFCRRNFNPLPPCGGRPVQNAIVCGSHRISIHSLRVEGDAGSWY